MHFWSKYWLQLVVTYCADKLTCSKWGKCLLLSSIWPWRPRSIAPQNNRDLNRGLLHLWSKFGDPSLKGWWIIARTSSWLSETRTHTHIHTYSHAGNDNTPRPKLAPGNKTMAVGLPNKEDHSSSMGWPLSVSYSHVTKHNDINT